MFKLTVLGSGPTDKIPREGCDRDVCKAAREPNSKSRRLQSSAVVTVGDKKVPQNVLINATDDIKKQFQENEVSHIEYILISHGNDDAIMGLNDLNEILKPNGDKIPVYLEEETWNRVLDDFEKESLEVVDPKFIEPGDTISIADTEVISFRVPHSRKPKKYPTVGFCFKQDNKKLCYAEDTSAPTHDELPDESLEIIKNSNLLVWDGAMWEDQIYNHNTIQKALPKIFERYESKELIFTQIGITAPKYEELVKEIKDMNTNADAAFDGMTVNMANYSEEEVVENIEDIENYDPSKLDDDVLADDWRILVAWTAQKIEDGDW